MDLELAKEVNAILWKAILFAIPSLIVQIMFSIAVLRDAKGRQADGRGTVFVGPRLWALATLIGGIFVVTAYWLMHHSSLRLSATDSVQAQKEWA